MSQQNDLASLMHHLVALLSRESDQTLQEQLGIGLAQYKILATLHGHPHLQQRVIAAILGQTEASISRQIKLLTDKGMLVALKDPSNHRAHMTNLTAKGLHIISAAEKVLASHHRVFFAGLNNKEQAKLLEELTSLHRSACFMEHPGLYDDMQ
jgi:DNA-binding MarR family transcriptional regulator